MSDNKRIKKGDCQQEHIAAGGSEGDDDDGIFYWHTRSSLGQAEPNIRFIRAGEKSNSIKKMTEQTENEITSLVEKVRNP
ncbi:unnamed protein product [Larinioides sclopetarius]|uniref:Uncharacterized protein n=1 Tax=Larinioides sclopetarius TaxID=280406 RepID=A0AAV1ZER2_9ARAC